MADVGKSPEVKDWRDKLNQLTRKHFKDSIRPQRVIARRHEAKIDTMQLNSRQAVQLRITAADVNEDAGITEADIGKFWFVVGYSKVGGPDLVRP